MLTNAWSKEGDSCKSISVSLTLTTKAALMHSWDKAMAMTLGRWFQAVAGLGRYRKIRMI